MFQAQVKTLRREINKRRRKLERLQTHLERSSRRSGGKKPTLAGTRKRVDVILAGRRMKELLAVSVIHDRRQLPKLAWRFDEQAWARLQRTLLGKTILQEQIVVSLARRVERLADIREVAILFHDADAHSPGARLVLSDLDAEQQKMMKILGLDRFRAS